MHMLIMRMLIMSINYDIMSVKGVHSMGIKMKVLYVIGSSQYDSTAVFFQEMAERMESVGWEVSLLDGRDVEGYDARRERVLQETFDVIFTINGMLLEEDSALGRQLLQKGEPVYCTYLMDHPFIHYERLKNEYPRIFVLSPDRNHVEYTDTYLKNIWGTAFLPHGGCRGSENRPYADREIDVSFMGSFVSAQEVWKGFERYPRQMRQLLEDMAQWLVENPDQTLESGAHQIFERYGIDVQDGQFPEIFCEFREVDRYVRSYFREQVIRILTEGKIRVDVYGDGWEKFPSQAREYLVIHPPVGYQESLDIIGNTKISLNVMPWFKDGSHDRVFTAMLCGAVCLTDGSRYLEEVLQETENVYFYSLKGLKYLPRKVRRILEEEEQSARVAENARRDAEALHTWAKRADEVMDYLGQLTALPGGAWADDAPEEASQELQLYYDEVIAPGILLLRDIRQTVYYLRRQAYLYAMRRVRGVLDRLEVQLSAYTKWKEAIASLLGAFDESLLVQMFQDILYAQEQGDYIWLADLLELQLIPFVLQIQESYAGAAGEVVLREEGCRVELTSSGAYTLAVSGETGWKYLHTNGNPDEEARLLAESWFDGQHYDYIVYGLGLGYHIQALLDMDEAVRVTVLEADSHILELAETYGLAGEWQDSDRVRIIIDEDFTRLVRLSEAMTGEEVFVVHYPSLLQIKNAHYRAQLEEYFISYSSMQTQMYRLTGNFVRNRRYFNQEVSSLAERFRGKNVYIIAAGPSLDRNMMELKRVQGHGIILATGTVLKKMLAAGIRPDYVIITDGGSFTYSQTSGIEERGVPLLYLPTVYYKIVAEYPGERYLICQKDFDKSEEYAREHGYPLFETGGSVTTTALDVSIRLGCSTVVFVGLDLAYTGQRDHASGTAFAKEAKGNLLVEDIFGNKVQTAKNLDIYRRWIEKRIVQEDASGIDFIDATEGGARIQGTRMKRLRDII